MSSPGQLMYPWQQDPQGYLASLIGAPVQITSGYRTPAHNAAVGGVPNSAHMEGDPAHPYAFDVVPQGMSMSDAASRLASSGVPYDQVINEGNHVHVSFDPRMRGQAFGMNGGSSPQVVAQSSDPLDAMLAQRASQKSAPQQQASPAAPAPTQSAPDPLDAMLAQQASAKPSAQPQANQTSPPQQQTISTLGDVARMGGAGLFQGGAAILGAPGDIGRLAGAGIQYLGAKVGLGSQTKNALTGYQNFTDHFLPTSGEINNFVQNHLGKYPQAQTTAGAYANTIGQFAPNLLAPEESVPAKLGRLLVPAVASETAGQITKGTELEPWARFGGALLGGTVQGTAESLLGKPDAIAIPTVADLKAASGNAYDAAEQAGVIINKDAVQNLGNQIKSAVADAGIDQTLHPQAMAAVNRILNTNDNVTFKGLDILRRVANGAAQSNSPDERRIARIVVDHIDDFVENMGPNDVLSGDAQQAASSIQDARSLWSRAAKGQILDDIMEKAKNSAQNQTGAGIENAVRTSFRQLANNKQKFSRFNPDEQAAILKVVRGGPLENTLKYFGKFGPQSPIYSGIAAGVGGAIGSVAGPGGAAVGAAMAPMIGAAARSAAANATLKNADLASMLVRNGEALPPMGANLKIIPRRAALAAALQSRANQDQQQPAIPLNMTPYYP